MQLSYLAERGAVDNTEFLQSLGQAVPEKAGRQLLAFRDELLRWNQKVNLTAITEPREVLEKHFFDSLAILPEVQGAKSLLDLGAGAGFPGIPLKVALPELEVTLADSVAKKVGFLKHALALLQLSGARALHARAEGTPEAEGLPRTEVVVSRALMDLADWARLGHHYLAPGGRLLAMTGQEPPAGVIEKLQAELGFASFAVRRYELPFSFAQRHVVTFRL
jgi:16S rRNA (guanine527-N7)-methyltransferase